MYIMLYYTYTYYTVEHICRMSQIQSAAWGRGRTLVGAQIFGKVKLSSDVQNDKADKFSAQMFRKVKLINFQLKCLAR